ncbi:hypothetical protein [Asticcacaulis sp. AND118]|uniref:hypothetical protein n=1 Tax=Asticcacaulis sp. AND118 TaxID=2840468 RepID=UPI001CFF78CC|nr:hypothetical protein [Asticcacaulis sp. AND118]UDF05678.1 hypothetical protein LH365_18150 [Asticcacaulis sp. AND118]
MADQQTKGWGETGRVLLAFLLAPLPLPFFTSAALREPSFLLSLFVPAYLFAWTALFLFGLPWHFLMKALKQRSILGYLVGGSLAGTILWVLFFGSVSTQSVIDAILELATGQHYLPQLGFALGSGLICAGVFWWVVIRWSGPFHSTRPRLDQNL